MEKQELEQALLRVSLAVREACVQAALEAYEGGGISGLCAEGRWELAVDAMRSLDLRAIMRESESLRGEAFDGAGPPAPT